MKADVAQSPRGEGSESNAGCCCEEVVLDASLCRTCYINSLKRIFLKSRSWK
jgi:hypothetical protein